MPISLGELFALLAEEYGETRWWPGETPFEVMVGAILTQNTAWRNVEKAISNMRSAGLLSPEAIASTSMSALRDAIRPAGFYNQKARYLVALSRYMLRRHGGSVERMRRMRTEALRRELLDLPGIGPETADSILLYALGRPTFVVDSYTYRLLDRLCIPHRREYEATKAMFEAELGYETHKLAEMHALIVIHCKEVCRKKPLCDRCVLSRVCPSHGKQV